MVGCAANIAVCSSSIEAKKSIRALFSVGGFTAVELPSAFDDEAAGVAGIKNYQK